MFSNSPKIAACFALSLFVCDVASGRDRFQMLDLQVGNEQLTGRIAAHRDDWCWLLERDGRLRRLEIDKVAEFSERHDRFKCLTHRELAKQLQSEFGANFDVATTSHYVVVAGQGKADDYAAVFERIYGEFFRVFRGRGLHLQESEFPLTGIVLPDQAHFAKYCQEERTKAVPGLVGCYFPLSNRVAFFEHSGSFRLDDTAIHEATHQVAFNTGVHSRIAQQPRWVVEGLATAFEADGIRSRQGTSVASERVNRQRFLWFLEYSKSRRSSQALREFLSSDELFNRSVMDAYSESWALSFYLMEMQPSAYSKYLKRLVDRDPWETHDEKTRLKDFVDSFGPDLDRFETSYLRFIRQLATR